MDNSRAKMADLAAFRQMSYSLLSAVFLGNWNETGELIRDTAGEVLAVSHWAMELSFYPAVSDFLSRSSDLDSQGMNDAATGFQRLFGPTRANNPIPLNETSFLVPGAEETGWVLASVERHYSSAGIESTSASGNIPDHIAVEFEFLAFLCGNESDAWSNDDFKEARRMQDRQRRFLEQHPSIWVPILARAIDARDDSYFSSVARAAHAQVAHDLDFLNSLRPLMRAAQ